MFCPAYILCGGRSLRFGADKARAEMDGQPQLLRLSARLRAAGHALYYVADRADRYRDLGVECLVDLQAESGPLAGLGCALAHRAAQLAKKSATEPPNEPDLSDAVAVDNGWLLLVSCDQAQWNPAWYEELFGQASALRPAVQAAAFYDTAWQPLPGLYHTALLPEVERRLAEGRLSLRSLCSDLHALERCARVSTSASPSGWSFNTPDELARLRTP